MFEKAGMKAVKSDLVDAPIIVGSKVVLECEVIEFVDIPNFNCIVARVVNLKADESVLGANSKIDTSKIGMIFYESFNNQYFSLGEKAGNALGGRPEVYVILSATILLIHENSPYHRDTEDSFVIIQDHKVMVPSTNRIEEILSHIIGLPWVDEGTIVTIAT